MQTNKTKVLIVDDHPFFRSGLASWVGQQPDLECSGEAGSVAELRKLFDARKPDLLLLDLRLPDGDGLDLIPELIRIHPQMRIIVLSQHDEDMYAHRVLRAGGRAYLMKSEATDCLRTAIDAVLRGEVYVSRRVFARLTQNLFPDPADTDCSLASLSDREMQVFQLLGAGCSTREIAAILKISPKTVDTYREHLKEKLRVPHSAALLSTAASWVATGRLPSR